MSAILGSDNYIANTTTDIDYPTTESKLFVGTWVKTTSNDNATQYVIAIGTSATSGGVTVQLDTVASPATIGRDIKCKLFDDSGSLTVVESMELADDEHTIDEWLHVAFLIDNDNKEFKFWVGGVQRGGTKDITGYTFDANWSRFVIGRRHDLNATVDLIGQVTDFFVYGGDASGDLAEIMTKGAAVKLAGAALLHSDAAIDQIGDSEAKAESGALAEVSTITYDPADTPTNLTYGVSWTMVVIPDTQKYVEDGAALAKLQAQFDWIVASKAGRRIKFVGHVGDLVEDNSETGVDGEWERIQTEMFKLNDIGILYMMATGNHDFTSGANTNINTFFDITDNSDNVTQALTNRVTNQMELGQYMKWTAPNGRLILFMTLGYYNTQEERLWAQTVANSNPTYQVVLVTHANIREANLSLDTDPISMRADTDDTQVTPTSPMGAGVELYNDFTGQVSNIDIVVNGHYLNDSGTAGEVTDAEIGVATTARVSSTNTIAGTVGTPGVFGNLFMEECFNTQQAANDGDAWFKVYEWMEDGITIKSKTFSPNDLAGAKNWLTDARHQFTFTLDQTGVNDREPLVYAKMDDTTGDPADSSGNAYTLTLVGLPVDDTEWLTAGGQLNGALHRDEDGSFTITDDVTLRGIIYSLSFWLRWDNTPSLVSAQGIFRKITGTQRLYEMKLNTNGTIEIAVQNGGNSPTLTSTTAIAAGTWGHVVIICDGTNLWMYLNNVLQSPTDSKQVAARVGAAATSDISIGSTSGLTGLDYDELRIWDRVLHPTEVNRWYTEGTDSFKNDDAALGLGVGLGP